MNKVKEVKNNNVLIGYMVDDISFYPIENCKMVKEWLKNKKNKIEAEFTEAEIGAQVKQQAEQAKTEALAKLTVTTSSGKVFYADTESRVDLNDAIRRAEKENILETVWKLAEEFEGERVVIVTLDEIREAADLALSAKGSIVGVIQIKEGE